MTSEMSYETLVKIQSLKIAIVFILEVCITDIKTIRILEHNIIYFVRSHYMMH